MICILLCCLRASEIGFAYGVDIPVEHAKYDTINVFNCRFSTVGIKIIDPGRYSLLIKNSMFSRIRDKIPILFQTSGNLHIQNTFANDCMNNESSFLFSHQIDTSTNIIKCVSLRDSISKTTIITTKSTNSQMEYINITSSSSASNLLDFSQFTTKISYLNIFNSNANVILSIAPGVWSECKLISSYFKNIASKCLIYTEIQMTISDVTFLSFTGTLIETTNSAIFNDYWADNTNYKGNVCFSNEKISPGYFVDWNTTNYETFQNIEYPMTMCTIAQTKLAKRKLTSKTLFGASYLLSSFQS